MSLQSLPVDARSLDEIYTAAQKEYGSLVVAAGGDGKPSSRLTVKKYVIVYLLTSTEQPRHNGMDFEAFLESDFQK